MGYGLTYGPTASGVKKAFRTYRDYIRFYTNAMGDGYVF